MFDLFVALSLISLGVSGAKKWVIQIQNKVFFDYTLAGKF